MRRLQPFWFLLFGVLAIDASAQDESRHTSTPTCLQLFCDTGQRDSRLPSTTGWKFFSGSCPLASP
jgi:hypothetical protein